ncbi:uncharacterized protein [Typha angustifolia]|uniref:uncharacterized protein isoform X1 n=1 Tax=Typha angustifolia TaxID=59011 RepID=UPI003C301BAD
MTETLTPSEGLEAESVDLETIRSRLKELSERRMDGFESYDPHNFLEKIEQMESEVSNISSLEGEDLGTDIEWMRKEIVSLEAENSKLSAEISSLRSTEAQDLAQLDGELEALSCSLKFINSEDMCCLQSSIPDGRLVSGDLCGSEVHALEDYKFEILELDQQIEKNKSSLSILQDLDYALKSVEAIAQVENMLSGVNVIGFEGNCIRLLLKTPVCTTDGLLLGHKLNFAIEPFATDHELLVEVIDKTMELKSVEIFPDDVYIDGIAQMLKSSRDFIPSTTSSLGWFIRQVQHRILLCSLRHLLVKNANKSRHTFKYSDRDETVIVHMVGGIDAFIRIPLDWPISSSAPKLISIRSSDMQSKSISLSFLCKIKDLANSLKVQTRQHLVQFVDAIEEILIREMQSELHSSSTSC